MYITYLLTSRTSSLTFSSCLLIKVWFIFIGRIRNFYDPCSSVIIKTNVNILLSAVPDDRRTDPGNDILYACESESLEISRMIEKRSSCSYFRRMVSEPQTVFSGIKPLNLMPGEKLRGIACDARHRGDQIRNHQMAATF